MRIKIRYFDFDFNLEKIHEITKNFSFNFNCYFPHISCVNLAYFKEYMSILEEIKKLKLDSKKNLLIFYGKLSENYNGDDHVRFLKNNDLRCCVWANNPYLILPALRMAEIIRI